MRLDEHFRGTTISTEIVVADTSPLNYLVQLNCDFLLPLLYQRVIVPTSVVAELGHSGTPQEVACWAASLPNWIEVLSAKTAPDPQLSRLDVGERDAIQLALELGVSKVLIDELRGRQEALSRGLTVVGTVGVLVAGQKAGILHDAQNAFDRLVDQTTFRSSPALRQSFLDALAT